MNELPPIDPTIQAAMRSATPAVDPRMALANAFSQWSGLSGMQLGALGLTVERTLDPDAIGGWAVRLCARMVLTRNGPKLTIEEGSSGNPA